MSRTHRFIFALGSSYIALAANVLYVVFSIPLALHYLSPQQFGLWSIVVPLREYLSLFDLGLSTSVARLLVDAKDDINGGLYGSLLQTATLIFGALAIIVISFGFFFSHTISLVMAIPPDLAPVFETLIRWQCAITAITFLSAPFGFLPLWSHQRSDLTNFALVGFFAAGLLSMWIGLKAGLGLYSIVLSNAVSAVTSIGFMTLASLCQKLFPTKGHWGAISKERFWEVCHFSRDMFVVGVASEVIYLSQMVLVSRILGLNGAGVWSVCVKSFNMARLLIFKLYDASSAALSEMIVRGELDRFRARFANIIALSALSAAFFAVFLAFANAGFVKIWTGGKLTWDMASDITAAIYLFSFTVARCYTGLTGILKKVQSFKYVSLAEGFLVILGSIILTPRLGFWGILLSSLFANLLCSGLYGMFRVSRHFGLSIGEVTVDWLTNALLYTLAFVLCCFPLFWLGERLGGTLAFLASASLSGLLGLVLALLLGLPGDLRKDLVCSATEFLGRYFPRRGQRSAALVD
jgi:O-antigen/teichoic acid export membrane protein